MILFRPLRVLHAAALLLIAVLPLKLLAQNIPDAPNPPRLVNDYAHCMSADQVQRLEDKLVNFDKSSSTQITIVTLTTLDGYDISEYAVELANKWEIGNKGKNNGVLVLAAIQDRKLNISTGYGLEGALPDITTAHIRQQQMNPYFKQGDYYTGFDKGTDAIIAATKGEYKADPSDRKKKDVSIMGIVAMIAIIYFILWIISKIGGGGGNYMSGRGYRRFDRGFGGGFLGGFLGGSMGRGWGGGGDWGGGSSSGGGFGGFGGGSFGGGGSSGSW